MTAPAPILDRPRSVEVRVLFFGKLADRFGRRRDIAIPADGCTVGDLRRRLMADIEDGALLAEPGVRAAVDHHLILDDQAQVCAGQEVAFLPAFSGG